MRLPRLWRGRRARLIALLIGNGFAQAGAAIAAAILARMAFDRAMAGGAPDALSFGEVMALLGAALLVTLVLRVVERIHAARLGEDYVTRIRLRLFKALTTDPVSAAQRRSPGPIMLRFVTDLTAVRRWISDGLSRLIVGSLATLGGIAALFFISPLIGAAVSAATVSALLAGAALRLPLANKIRATRRHRARLASHIGDRLGALDVVKISGQARREQRSLARHSARLAEAAVERARVAGAVQILPDTALGVATFAVLVIGGLQVSAQETTPGTILAALLLLGAIAPQARALGRAFEHWVNYKVATVKLKQILRTARPARRPRRRLTMPTGDLILEDIVVDGRLSGVSATLSAGTRVAVIGPDGSGKATLLGILASRLRPDSGRILLNGVDMAEIDPRSLARHVGAASSGMPLLKGTVRYNLSYRLGRASERDIADACRLCGIREAIAGLPHGLDFRVTEKAAALSGRLRQGLILARAVVGDPAVLLIDERNFGTGAALGRVLESRPGTTLIVTENPDRIRDADVVWYLEDGLLREAGPPTELFAAKGPAAQFMRSLEGGLQVASVVRLDSRKPRPDSGTYGVQPVSSHPSKH